MTMVLLEDAFQGIVLNELPLKSSSGKRAPPAVLLPYIDIAPVGLITTLISGAEAVPE